MATGRARLHRIGQIEPLLDRYSALRKALIGVRRLAPALTADMETQIQNATTTLATIEDVVERARAKGSSSDFVRLNRLLSRDIDELHAVLIDMTAANKEEI